jgi:hemerythrin-like domain-containing protein
MDALGVLMEEHVVILEIAEVLNNSAKKLQAKEKVSTEFFEKMLDVVQNFIDKRHHGKEEMALFPLISKHGGKEDLNDYIGLLAQHVKKENVVFPTWINSFSDETKKELLERFIEIDANVIDPKNHQEYVQTIEQLKILSSFNWRVGIYEV